MDLVKVKESIESRENVKTSEIVEKAEETKNEADAKVIEKLAKPKKKIERRIKFSVKYNDLDKDKELKSVVVSKVMDSDARLKYDQVLMTLAAGHPFEDYPQAQKTRFQCLARIICQIESVDQWVLEKAGEDLDFCFTVASKLVEHENRYFRYYDTKNSNEASKSRFSVDFPEFEEDASA